MAVSVEIADQFEERKPEKLELTCGTCGYGIVVRSEPPVCPMCRSSAWELTRREPVRLRVLSWPSAVPSSSALDRASARS
jgi:hypothetical protein